MSNIDLQKALRQSLVVDRVAQETKAARQAAKDFRRDRASNGRIRFMALAKGWVMVRRPGCLPFVMPENEWRQLPYLGSA